MDANRLKQIIEGALLAAGQTLDVKRLLELFANDSEEILQGKVTAEDIDAALEAIVKDCEGRGFELKQVSSGWRFQVREETAQWVNRLWEEKPQKYSRAMLETLALIAYRQPITRGDIEQIRGVAVSSHIIKTLSERDWVKVVGHRDVPGRPSLYATTKTFLDYFNLKSLEELPSLGELADIEQLNSELNLEVKPENTGDNTDSKAEGSDNSEADAAAVDSNVADRDVAHVEADVSEQNPDSEGVDLDKSENIESVDIEQTQDSDSTTGVDEQVFVEEAPVEELVTESDADEADREKVVVDEETSSPVDSQIDSVESREFESDALDAPVDSDAIDAESTEDNEEADVVSEESETQSEQVDIDADDEQDLSLAPQDPIDEENETELVSEPAIDEPEIEAEPSSVETENQDQLVDDEESEEDEKPVEHKAKSLFDIS